jgi:hypothetical protein
MKPETGRNKSFTRVIEELESTYNQPIVIVETGCIRTPREESKIGDGWSTVNWEYYSKKTNSRTYVVDINDGHLNAAKQVVPESEFVTYTKQDSIEYLKQFDKKIDLLFLDSFDYCGPQENIDACHNHCLGEVKAAWDKLNEHCFILIDDVFGDDYHGKGFLAIPYLLDNGFELVYLFDSQALLKR